MAITKKIDKRSKEYRDAHKKSKFVYTGKKIQESILAKGLVDSMPESLIKNLQKDLGKIIVTKTIAGTIKEMQSQIDGLSTRISQLETKVG